MGDIYCTRYCCWIIDTNKISSYKVYDYICFYMAREIIFSNIVHLSVLKKSLVYNRIPLHVVSEYLRCLKVEGIWLWKLRKKLGAEDGERLTPLVISRGTGCFDGHEQQQWCTCYVVWRLLIKYNGCQTYQWWPLLR